MTWETANRDFFIRYAEEENLFAVYSEMLANAQDAAMLYQTLVDAGFTETGILHAPSPGPEPLTFSVQIAALQTEAQAMEQKATAENDLNISLEVMYDDFTGKYAVRTPAFQSIPEAREILQEIRKVPGHDESFMVSIPRLPSIPIIFLSGF